MSLGARFESTRLCLLTFALYFHASVQHVISQLPAPAAFACPHAVSIIINLELWNQKPK